LDSYFINNDGLFLTGEELEKQQNLLEDLMVFPT